MKTHTSHLALLLGAFIFSTSLGFDARATEGSTDMDGHIGSGGYFEIGTPAAAGGVYGDFEVAGWDNVKLGSGSEHLVIGDARVMASLVFGRSTDANDQGVNLFALRLEGNAAFGLQAYKVIPLNVSLEDASYINSNQGSRGTALLGTTIYLPISIARDSSDENAEAPVLFVALTSGARWNTELRDTAAFGIQPKVRLMSEKFSAELRYLMTLGTPEAEKKVGAYFAYKNLFRRGDEIGISYSQTWANQAGNELNRGPEVFVFYGIRE
jgi:hypothetical protein